jgi:hypothetical protein
MRSIQILQLYEVGAGTGLAGTGVTVLGTVLAGTEGGGKVRLYAKNIGLLYCLTTVRQ